MTLVMTSLPLARIFHTMFALLPFAAPPPERPGELARRLYYTLNVRSRGKQLVLFSKNQNRLREPFSSNTGLEVREVEAKSVRALSRYFGMKFLWLETR